MGEEAGRWSYDGVLFENCASTAVRLKAAITLVFLFKYRRCAAQCRRTFVFLSHWGCASVFEGRACST
jgi:hypothetical protein